MDLELEDLGDAEDARLTLEGPVGVSTGLR
jgi:hypothetical protein